MAYLLYQRTHCRMTRAWKRRSLKAFIPGLRGQIAGGAQPTSIPTPANATVPGTMGGTIFISYRREQDAGFAGRLFDRLERTFRRKALFMDVDSISPGQDFPSIVEARVAECDALLALIGRGWLTATDEAGRRRLDNAEDFVRIEIATALTQAKRVIPVLIDDAPMPQSEDLPEVLKPLVRRQATRLSHERFKADSDRLIRAIRQVLADAEKVHREDEARRETQPSTPSPPPDGTSGSWEESLTPTPRPRKRVREARREPSRAKAIKEIAVFRDVDAPWCPEMVALPVYEFLMGSPEDEEGRYSDEGTQHRVTIDRRFAIGRYAVTFDEYDHFCAVTGRRKPKDKGWGRGRRPVIHISWRDAVAYCAWLANETGHHYRLPSEAEWEYAARAGTTTRYAFGDAITPRDANYSESKLSKTTEAGSYPPNAWGLYDMHGNVWEWVEDVWHDSYKGAPNDGSAWTDGEGQNSSSLRVLRGGSWDGDPRDLRSANRGGDGPGSRGSILGFRVART